MTKHHHRHERTHCLEQEISDVRAPYWRRAHRDWRFLTVVFVMLACIAIYIMTGDFAWTSHGHAVQMLDSGGHP